MYQFHESPAEVEVGIGERYGTQDKFHQYEPRKYAKTTIRVGRSAEPQVYCPCPPASQKCHDSISANRTGKPRSKPPKKRSPTDDTSPRSAQNRRTSVSSPTVSMGDLELGKPGRTRPPVLKADDARKELQAQAEQKRSDETETALKARKHADTERERRGNTGIRTDGIQKSLLQLLGRPFKPSDCKKPFVPKLTIMEECSDFLEECIQCFKTLEGKGQSFISVIQTSMAELQSLRSENSNLKQEILRLQSGVPTPPSSNHPSPIRGSHSQPGSGSMGHHRKESHR